MTVSTEGRHATSSDRLIPVVNAAEPVVKDGTGTRTIVNESAMGFPFFTPEQDIAPGTAIKDNDRPTPKLFTPLKIRGIEMPNRIWLSPMCQYSSHEGFQGPWQITHYGGIAQRGTGLTMVEAAAVQANGRLTPEDAGIWLDAHIEGLRKHVDFAHSQKNLIGIQLAHAGPKSSYVAPWLSTGAIATEEAGGWPNNVVGPTDEKYDESYPKPRALTIPEIEEIKKDFQRGVIRAVHAGFDVVEMHFAHGYLVSSFLSPSANKRMDKYGGSFENRARLALEIVEDARAVLPEKTPLWVRISATDWLDNNPAYEGEKWTVDESIKLAHLFAERGVDVLDVSSGGIHPMQKVISGPGYQAGLAKKIKKSVGKKLLVSAVGSIKTGTLAEELITGGKDEDDTPLDLIAAGRMFQKNPGLVWYWADDLETPIHVAKQIGWGFGGRAALKKESGKINIP